MTKLITRNPTGLSVDQRLDIRNYILNYLASNPKLAPFVLQALVTLFARITKVGWVDMKNEQFVFRDIIPHISHFVGVCFVFYLITKFFYNFKILLK